MPCSIAPGKILLFGEHFVVKGKPAIGMAVSVYAKTCVSKGVGIVESGQLGILVDLSSRVVNDRGVHKIIEELSKRGILKNNFHAVIESQIPIGSGMGSSAAVSSALAHALTVFSGFEPSKELVWEVSFEAEKIYHVNPSGIDNTLSVYGGIILYKDKSFRRLEIKWPEDIYIVVVDSRIKRSTGQVVADVLSRYEKYPTIYSRIYEAGEAIVTEALKALETGDFVRLGELMDINHGLLASISVSSSAIDRIVWSIREAGALGVKVSGAGRGGIVIALVEEARRDNVSNRVRELGLEPLLAKPDLKGVRALSPYG
ncbi:mevalonate kinase [Thermogladius sp. 4427co]|uniref:mevalonate kinase n=1 Tax=Thermogladius sp. 4427co TaxID=3450718 RepID=UPI003F79A490